MRVLITGSNGQLGRELAKLFARQSLLATDRDTLDITDKKKVSRVFKKFKPEIVLHSAAYTQVDLAESEKKSAFLINEKGTINAAESAHKIGAKFVYISTDYIFDGAKNLPYTEEDVPCPLNIYGRSKLKGEEAAQKIYGLASLGASRGKRPVCLIIRTSWLYGQGENFVKTVLRLAGQKPEIKVVSDQIGSPTWARDLAFAIRALLLSNQSGIFHASGRGETSWFEFAEEIMRLKKLKVKIVPIKTEDFPRPAKRPPYSYLSTKKLDRIFKMPAWRISLKKYLDENSLNYR